MMRDDRFDNEDAEHVSPCGSLALKIEFFFLLTVVALGYVIALLSAIGAT